MAEKKTQGKGKKNRKLGRNKQYAMRRAGDGRADRNRKRSMLRALRAGKWNDRQLALKLHADYSLKFVRGPHDHDSGPYLPVGTKAPKWLKVAA